MRHIIFCHGATLRDALVYDTPRGVMLLRYARVIGKMITDGSGRC